MFADDWSSCSWFINWSFVVETFWGEVWKRIMKKNQNSLEKTDWNFQIVVESLFVSWEMLWIAFFSDQVHFNRIILFHVLSSCSIHCWFVPLFRLLSYTFQLSRLIQRQGRSKWPSHYVLMKTIIDVYAFSSKFLSMP